MGAPSDRWWEQVGHLLHGQGSALVWDFVPALGTYMTSCILRGASSSPSVKCPGQQRSYYLRTATTAPAPQAALDTRLAQQLPKQEAWDDLGRG